jgi:hypothetical protein
MIIGLTGYARSGKDSVAKILVDNYGFNRLAFADKVRGLLLELDPILEDGHHLRSIVKEYGWEIAKAKPEVRRLLQTLGFSARKLFGKNFWIHNCLDEIAPANYYIHNFVVTDVRFTNEAEAIKEKGGQLWRVNRPGVKAINDHISESELDNYPVDCIFVNYTSIEDLELSVKTRMQGLLR